MLLTVVVNVMLPVQSFDWIVTNCCFWTIYFTCNHFFNLIVSTFLYSNLNPTKILSVSGARFRKSVQAWILQASFPASSFRLVHLRGLFSYFTLCFFVYFTFIPQWQSEKHWPLWNKSKASQTIIGCKLRKKHLGCIIVFLNSGCSKKG